MLDWHTGLPFSIQDVYGRLAGQLDSKRFTQFFELNVAIEREVALRGDRMTLRGGINNVSGHFNPAAVQTIVGGADYLREYNAQPRSANLQIRFLQR